MTCARGLCDKASVCAKRKARRLFKRVKKKTYTLRFAAVCVCESCSSLSHPMHHARGAVRFVASPGGWALTVVASPGGWAFGGWALTVVASPGAGR